MNGLWSKLISPVLALALILPVLVSCTDDSVSFPDPNLETAIRKAIGKPEGPIPTKDLVSLYSLGVTQSISNLSGLEKCVNLTNLSLQQNEISDLSPLSSLINLTHLNLGQNRISDISPLSGLTSLIALDLAYNKISDISSLSSLTNLTYLNLAGNQINDISSFSLLTGISVLYLTSNQISDVSPLSSLTNLNTLWLQQNRISDISPLLHITNRTGLHLRQNPLGANSVDILIPRLLAQGVRVEYDSPAALLSGRSDDEFKAHVKQGTAYLKQEQWDKGITEFSNALELNSRAAEVYALRAVASLEEHEDRIAGDCEYRQILADAEKAVELDPQIKLDARLSSAYARLGGCYFKYRDYEKAISYHTKAILHDGDEAAYYAYRGEVYYQLGRYYDNLGQASKSVDIINKAIADFTKAIEIGVNDAETFNMRGKSYVANKDYYSAIDDFTSAIEIGEENAIVFYGNRGDTYAKLDDHKEALADYREALTLSGDDSYKEYILEQIEGLLSKLVIKDLAYIKVVAIGYSDDADPEIEGISIRITFYDSKSKYITFEEIPVTVLVELYGYKDWEDFGLTNNLPLVHREQVTIDHAVGFLGAEVRIPFTHFIADRNTYFGFGDMLVTISTPSQGEFRTVTSFVPIYD